MLDWFARRLKEVQEKDKTGQGGFTLIELLVVVIIIGILAAIAIPTFLAQRDRANSRAAQANVRTAATSQQAAYTETGSYVPVSGLAAYGFNAAGTTPTVAGTPTSGTSATYCLQATGGSDTWVMRETYGSPQKVATGGPAACS